MTITLTPAAEALMGVLDHLIEDEADLAAEATKATHRRLHREAIHLEAKAAGVEMAIAAVVEALDAEAGEVTATEDLRTEDALDAAQDR